MKTDDDSEEAKKPPGNNSGKQKNPVSDANAEKEELQRARRQVPKRAGQSREPRPGNANSGPAAPAMFRKTELWDKPPLFRSEEPMMRQKAMAAVLGPDTDIPYVPFEDSLRNLIGQVVRRQETIARRLAGQVDDLHDRIDALEDTIELMIARFDRRISSLEKERES
jgi:hypothetical protein